MKNKQKHGFTIVELVIVIAVIAILAAVLIPTFSGLIEKANLSADKQAVREMNMALSASEALYGKPENVEGAMQILANAGYNSDNWVCLTSGYKVYWYETDNRLILYNSTTAKVEYPTEYPATLFTDASTNGKLHIYNENHIKAQQFNMSFSSSDTGNTASGFESSNISGNVTTYTSTEAGANTNETNNLTSVNAALSNSTIKSAIVGNNDNVYVYATKEIVSSATSAAYASLQVSSAGPTETASEFTSDGNVRENLYYLEVVTNEGGATAAEITAAQKSAAEYIYNIFDQMTTGKVTSDATIIVDAGTTLDCAGYEWSPCKTFTGYFGTTNDSDPVVVSGATLSTATGYAETVGFEGSSSKYFVTGFFGTVYGDTTIENVTFKNIVMQTPAIDYQITQEDITGNKVNTRNTIGIIGGITDGYDTTGASHISANVTLRNIVVENSCELTGAGCCGGLVGYIGSADSNGKLAGTVNIENCTVSCSVISNDSTSANGYKAVGGLVGFLCRSDNVTVNIKGSTFDGKLEGYGCIGAGVGSVQQGTLNFAKLGEVSNDLSGATINENSTAQAVRGIVGYYNAGTVVTVAGTIYDTKLAMTGASNGSGGYDPKNYIDGKWVDVVQSGETWVKK